MKAQLRHTLVAAAVNSGNTVVTKSASATPAERDVIGAAWPTSDSPGTPLEKLASMLAVGSVIENSGAD